MTIQKRIRPGQLPLLILLPTKEESLLIDEVFGNKIIDDDGTIATGTCRVALSDGYGDHYISLKMLEGDQTA